MLLFSNVNFKDLFVKNENVLCPSVSFLFPRPYFYKLTILTNVYIKYVDDDKTKNYGHGLLEYKP